MGKIFLPFIVLFLLMMGCSKDNDSSEIKFPEDGVYTLTTHLNFFDKNGNKLGENFEGKGELTNEMVFDTKKEIGKHLIYYSASDVKKSVDRCIAARERELANLEKKDFPDKQKEIKRLMDLYQRCIDQASEPYKTAIFYKINKDIVNFYMFDDEELDGFYQPLYWKDLKLKRSGNDVILSFDFNKGQDYKRPEDFYYDHFNEVYRVAGEMVLTKK